MNQLEEFKALGLSDDILTAIAKKGFETPSAIQSLTIPHLLTTDKDIIAQAQTGTGKTAAFGLPIIQMLTSRRNIPQAIVLVPTRELALQVTQELISFNTHDLSIAPIYGGASMTEQLRRLKKGIDIVVGTPGRILDVEPEFYGIVFSRTRTGADEIVAKLLERGYAAEVLHGDISQTQREKILGKFKKKQVNILVATDVAARGIDVSNLTHVINYSLPQDSDSYVHRIGRTGRAGNQGTAITFISPSEMRKFGFLKRTIKADIKLEQLPTPADIIATKRNKIKEDLDAIVESESYGECTGMAAELLENYPPEVALSALLRLAFKNELSESSYPEIRSIDVDRKGKARIFLAFGARDGYDTRKTVRLLKQECGLSDHDIDDVRVMEDFSFATVPFDRAEKVVRALNKLSHGRPIAEISKDSPSARTSGGRQSHRRRESDTRSGRKTGRKPESRESYRQDSSVQEAFGAPDDRNGHRKSVRSPKTSGTKAGKKPATTVKASSKTSTPEKTAAKRASELPENWFEEWFGQRQPARNKKGPNRTPKRKNRD